jgi:glycosyltransferase involved in cell wall biosynthesis
MVARFDAQKDHRTLIHAFADLQEACLDLVGDGPTLEAVKVAVAELGIANRVNFYGYTEDVAEILARAHIFTLASNWEGFPRSTVEAMRAGLPTVVSAVGGASEAVSEGITGYSVPRSDVATLRDRLSILVEDRQKRAQFGNAARLRYMEYFTFDRMFDRTLALCDDVVAGQRIKSMRSEALVKARKRPIE